MLISKVEKFQNILRKIYALNTFTTIYLAGETAEFFCFPLFTLDYNKCVQKICSRLAIDPLLYRTAYINNYFDRILIITASPYSSHKTYLNMSDMADIFYDDVLQNLQTVLGRAHLKLIKEKLIEIENQMLLEAGKEELVKHGVSDY